MAASQSNPLAAFGKLTELKQRLLFVIAALFVYRLGSYIPLPGVNSDELARRAAAGGGGGLLDMINMFSGGAFSRLSVFALGVIPYISASIIVQMFATVVPAWQALRKEGESGRRKLTTYTRIGTLALALFQSFGLAVTQNQPGIVYAPGPSFIFTTMVGLTAGVMFLMWLGEQITERGIGNGISLLIFAGIVAGLPAAVVTTLGMAQSGELPILRVLIIFAVVVAVTAFVVFMERGQRRITVNYARRQGGAGKAYMNQSSHLPLKINMAGVIPPIFASSLLMFPATAATWFNNSNEIHWLQVLTASLGPGQPLHMFIYGLLIIVFAYFYTALTFNSQETADNLKRSGALIPGMRPGKATADYIDGVMTRLTGAGALYLVAVCLVPDLLRNAWNVPFYFGGTSLLIVVVVVMDFTAQIQAHLVSHQYESLLKKANLRGR